MFLALLYVLSVGVASWYKPMWGLALAANAFLINAILGNSSGFVFAIVGLGGPLTCFSALILQRLHNKVTLHTPFKLDAILVFLFFIISLLSVFYASNMYLSIEVAVRYLIFCASFYFAIQFVMYKENKDEVIKEYLKATLSIALVIGVYALMKGDSASDYVMRLTIGEVSPIPLSILLGQSVLIAFYFFVTSNKLNNIFYIPILLFLIYVLFLTNTRSTLIGVLLGLMLILFAGKSQISTKLYFKLIITCLIAIPVVIVVIGNDLSQFQRAFSGFNRLSSGELGESEGHRLLAWDYAFDAFSKEPFLGLGSGNFGQHYIAYPHNMLLEVLAENGLVGFFVIATLMSIGFKKVFTYNHGPYLVIAALFIFSFFVAQVSLTMWMHKGLFIWLAILLCSTKPNPSIRKMKIRFK